MPYIADALTFTAPTVTLALALAHAGEMTGPLAWPSLVAPLFIGCWRSARIWRGAPPKVIFHCYFADGTYRSALCQIAIPK